MAESRVAVRGIPAVRLCGAIALAFCSAASVLAAQEPGSFDAAEVRFEQNATDGDAEVVFEVTSGSTGLAHLIITAPDGRTVAEMRAPDSSRLGVRQVVLESPEPPDPGLVRAAYPEGEYSFRGVTVGGDTLGGRATLAHLLPAPAHVLAPADGADAVPTPGFRIRWRPDPDVVAYMVTIEQEDLGLTVSAQLAAGTSEFAVPDGFLMPGTEYKVAVGTQAAGGNRSFVEITFTTAEDT